MQFSFALPPLPFVSPASPSLCTELRGASGLHAAQVPVRLRPAAGILHGSGLPQTHHPGLQPCGKEKGRGLLGVEGEVAPRCH